MARIFTAVVHGDRKSRPLEELDIIIAIAKREDISICNPEHFCDRLGPDRFVDVGRSDFENFIFGPDNIHLRSEPPLDIPLKAVDRLGRMNKKEFLKPGRGQVIKLATFRLPARA